MWAEFEEPRGVALKSPRAMTALCVEVLSGDTLVVVPLPAGQAASKAPIDYAALAKSSNEVKILLASVRYVALSPNY